MEKKAKDNVTLINEKRELVTADMKKTEVLSEFFAFSDHQVVCVS